MTQDKSKNKAKYRKKDEKSNTIKKDKNALTNFKVCYQNVRGLKSKVDSLMGTITDYQPMLICLVETKL